MFFLCASAWALEGFFQPEQVELLEEELELSNIRVSQEILSNRQSSMLQSIVSLGHCTGIFCFKQWARINKQSTVWHKTQI